MEESSVILIHPCFSMSLRSPPLTLLHLSASKFSDAPSAGGIAGFLSSDVSSTQSKRSSTKPASEVKNESSSKQAGSIQSFFQKAAEKQRQVKKEEEDSVALTASLSSPSSNETSATEFQSLTDNGCPVSSNTLFPNFKKESASSRSGISSFFHKKNLERSSKESDSPVKKPTMGLTPESVPAEDSESTVAAVEHTCHQTQEDSKDSEPEANYQPPNITSEDLIKCDQCGKEVLVWEMPEHTDYHFALDLQKSLSSSTTSGTSGTSASSFPTPVRGKTKSRGQSGPQPKKQRSLSGGTGTLDSFFKRS